MSNQAEWTQVLWMACTPVLKLDDNENGSKEVHIKAPTSIIISSQAKSSGCPALLCWSWTAMTSQILMVTETVWRMDMEYHIYRRRSGHAALPYLLQLASTHGIPVQMWLMMVTRSVWQPEKVQSRLVCTSGFSEAFIKMHFIVWLLEEQLGHASWNFSQGAE